LLEIVTNKNLPKYSSLCLLHNHSAHPSSTLLSSTLLISKDKGHPNRILPTYRPKKEKKKCSTVSGSLRQIRQRGDSPHLLNKAFFCSKTPEHAQHMKCFSFDGTFTLQMAFHNPTREMKEEQAFS